MATHEMKFPTIVCRDTVGIFTLCVLHTATTLVFVRESVSLFGSARFVSAEHSDRLKMVRSTAERYPRRTLWRRYAGTLLSSSDSASLCGLELQGEVHCGEHR